MFPTRKFVKKKNEDGTNIYIFFSLFITKPMKMKSISKSVALNIDIFSIHRSSSYSMPGIF